MGYTISEKKALKKLGIPDFRHMTKDNIVSFVNMLPKMDPEVAKAAIAQFPEFSGLAKDMVTSLQGMVDKTIEESKDARKDYMVICQSILDSLKEELSRNNISARERDRIEDKMIQVIKLLGDRQEQAEKHIENILAVTGRTLIGVAACAILALGGSLILNALDIDPDNFKLLDKSPIDVDFEEID